jgi:hypothetical protein
VPLSVAADFLRNRLVTRQLIAPLSTSLMNLTRPAM